MVVRQRAPAFSLLPGVRERRWLPLAGSREMPFSWREGGQIGPAARARPASARSDLAAGSSSACGAAAGRAHVHAACCRYTECSSPGPDCPRASPPSTVQVRKAAGESVKPTKPAAPPRASPPYETRAPSPLRATHHHTVAAPRWRHPHRFVYTDTGTRPPSCSLTNPVCLQQAVYARGGRYACHARLLAARSGRTEQWHWRLATFPTLLCCVAIHATPARRLGGRLPLLSSGPTHRPELFRISMPFPITRTATCTLLVASAAYPSRHRAHQCGV